MVRPASRLIALKTCSGPTRSSSSTGGTTTTTIRLGAVPTVVASAGQVLRLEDRRRKAAFFDGDAMGPSTMRVRRRVSQAPTCPAVAVAKADGGFRRISVANRRVVLR